MKTKLERFALFLLLAPLAPLAGFMGFWFLAHAFLPEDWIPGVTIAGLLVGILIDLLVLKKLLDLAHKLSLAFWLAVFLFYSIGIFGLFMGVPVFNLALSIPAGFVIGGRLAYELADKGRVRSSGIRACILTTSLLAFICAASAFFALTSSSTPADLEGMLGLGFSITPAMIWAIILFGGAGLLAVNWVLTGLSVRITYHYFSGILKMDWLLGILATLLLFIVLALIWRAQRLRRGLKEYCALLHRAADEGNPFPKLPADVPGLEELSNAVKNLTGAYASQLGTTEAQRIRLASVLEQMTDGVIIADADGRVTFMNPAAERMFETQGTFGKRVAEVLRQYQLVEAWRRCQEKGEAQNETVELPIRRQFLQLFALPDRQTGGALLLVQDLTRVRRLETIRRDFISNVSHELRTPLASLKALTETLRDGALEDAEAAPRFLGRMETEVDALTQMAQELLDLSRIESGQVPLELAKVDPSRLLHDSAERMRAQVERAGLELTVEPATDLPEIQADATRLEQVLVNLIHNAVKFTPPGGDLSISAVREEKMVRFSVRDNGVGIPEEDLERIFERFFKADRARSGGGTGLGLSISRHIVETHGGRIWAESREGQGSTFFFTIPTS